MDRRASLALLLGRKKEKISQPTMAPAFANSFSPYAGSWGFEQAAHLLRRTTFGATYAQIKQAAANGLDDTISMLFQDHPLPDPPVYYDFENDPLVGLGETWVDEIETLGANAIRMARRRSIRGWTYLLYKNEGIS
ncbi:MAG: hypothetical protein AAF573_19860, partial [Bacteroidota bacterium]